MTDDLPRRRGRPPANAASSLSGDHERPSITESQAPIPKSQRRRRSSTGGHQLKLAAPPREGFTRRWVNDDGNRLAEAHELAYDHVIETGITSSDTGTRISRLVGTKANGEPLRAFLMETPTELYAEGVAEKEAHNRQVDDAIAAGRDSDGPMSQIPSSETYGQGSIQRGR